MADRGITKDCDQFFVNLTDTSKDVAEKCGVDASSLRAFRNGTKVIRRTTFNKISAAFQKNYQISVPADQHFSLVE